MALAGRTTRRASGRRWLAVGLVLTLLVLLADASIKSRSPGPTRQLTGVVWVDQVFGLVEQSDVQGRELYSLLTNTSSASPAAVSTSLADLRLGAQSTYRSYAALRPPTDLSAPAGLLETCLLVRSEAAGSIAGAVTTALSARLGTGAITRAGTTVAAAVQRLEVADQAYELFAAQLPGWLHVSPPASTWVSGAALATETTAVGLAVWLTSLHSRVSLAPVSSVTIEALSTTPSALGVRGRVQILSPGSQLVADVVVGNAGNQVENDLTVTASIAPSTGTASAREFVSTLAPGTSQAVTIGYLDPPLGQDVTLTVTLTPETGDPAAPVTRTVTFEMPSPTTAAPSTTTTVPGTATGSSTSTTSSTPSTSSTSGATGTTGTAPPPST